MAKKYLYIILLLVSLGTFRAIAQDTKQLPKTQEKTAIEGLNLFPNPVTGGKVSISTKNDFNKDIAIFDLIKVHDDAHARFDATKRTYEYHIHTKKNAFESDDSWYYSLPLDVEKMNEACKILFEYIDFECFSKTHTDVNTFNCKIFEANWKQNEDKLVFTIAADRFLRNMVRAIVGTMINIGSGKVSLNDFRKIIESKNRSKAGFSVPAHGLYLTKIEYPYLSDE
mgnify:CR=1 FL=1